MPEAVPPLYQSYNPAHPPLAWSLEQLEAFSLARPFHQWLDLHITELSAAGVTVTLQARRDFISNPELQSVHGGVIATLIDATAGFAVISRLGRSVPTVDLRIDYHRMAAAGTLRAKGRVIDLGRSLAVAEASIYDAKDVLIASGRGTYFCREKEWSQKTK